MLITSKPKGFSRTRGAGNRSGRSVRGQGSAGKLGCSAGRGGGAEVREVREVREVGALCRRVGRGLRHLVALARPYGLDYDLPVRREHAAFSSRRVASQASREPQAVVLVAVVVAFAATSASGCAPKIEARSVADIQSFDYCTENEEYVALVTDADGWRRYLAEFDAISMIERFQAPDTVTKLPDGSTAYSYLFGKERKSWMTAIRHETWGASEGRAAVLVDDVLLAYGVSRGQADSIERATSTEVQSVACKTTFIFSPAGELLRTPFEGSACVWPGPVTRVRKARVPCPPRPPPARRNCDTVEFVPVLYSCPIYSKDGTYSGFDLSRGGKLYRESSNCEFATTYGRGVGDYIFVSSSKHEVEGYVDGDCVGEAEGD